jgi:hypothetical protein
MKQSAELNRTTHRTGRFLALLAFAAIAFLLSASQASAGCGYGYNGAKPSNPSGNPPAGWDNYPDQPATMVGLWHVIYSATSSTPPFPTAPFKFLESYKTWHHDGTEFENAFLSPEGGNVCVGVWKEEGKNTVKLHHIGLMFDSSGNISNVFTVDEIDTVANNGKSYSGTFDFKLFDPSDVLGTGAPIAEVKGKTAATRITVQ